MAKHLLAWTALLLFGCGEGDDGYQEVPEPPNQSVAFASDPVEPGAQRAEFRSAALTSDCASACTGTCASFCRAACQLCPAAVSCLGRIGAGTTCELGAEVCAIQHCPDLEGEDVEIDFE